MIARLAWWTALAGLAVVAVFAHLDRASENRPQLAAFVPPPFRSFAQVPMALVATMAASPEAARAEAERLVRRRPLPAEHLFALAVADLRDGDKAGYAAAFRLATTRGWRSPAVQDVASREALAAGDYAAASNRVAALWALDANSPALGTLTTQLLADPGGREAFAGALAGTRVWQRAFLRKGLELAPPTQMARLLSRAQTLGAQFDCATLAKAAASIDQPIPGQPNC